MRWVEILRQNIEYARDANSVTRTGSGGSIYAGSIAEERRRPGTSGTLGASHDPSLQSSPAGSFGDRDSVLGDDETFAGDDELVPRADDFDLLANGTKTQLELTQQLLDSLVVPSRGDDGSVPVERSSSASSRPSSILSSTARQADVKDALRGSLASLGSMLDEYVDVVAQRERYFVRKYEREIEAKRLWEENMREVAASHAAMEIELQKASRDNTRRKKALQEVRATLGGATSPLAGGQSPHLGSTRVLEDDSEQYAQLSEEGTDALPPPLTTSGSSMSLEPPATRRGISAGSDRKSVV